MLVTLMVMMYVYFCFILAYATRTVPRMCCEEVVERYKATKREVKIMIAYLTFLVVFSVVGLRLAVSPTTYWVLIRQVMLIYVSTLITYIFFAFAVLRPRAKACERLR